MKILNKKHTPRPGETSKFVAGAPRSFIRQRGGLGLMLAACMAWNAGFLHAQTTVWNGSVDTDWHKVDNWSNGLPGTGILAEISASGPVLLSGGNAAAGILEIAGNQSLAVSNGAQLNGTQIRIGVNSPGEMLVTGTNTIVSYVSGKASLVIGSSSDGTLTISNGALLSATPTTSDTPVIIAQGPVNGTLNLNSGGILQTRNILKISSGNAKINFDGGILRSIDNTTNLLGNFQAGNVELLAGGGTFDTNGFDATATNIISGTGSLTKQGAGTLTLSGANAYTGSTQIESGTLSLGTTGSLHDSSGIDIASGATFDVSGLAGGFTLGASQTLSGNGTILGNVTMAGTLAPGSSTGELKFTGDLLLDSAAIIQMEIASLSDFDRVVVESMLTFGGTLTLSFLDDFLPSIGDTFDLFQGFTSSSGTFDNIVFMDPHYTADFDYSTGQLTFTAIPEPSTAFLLGLTALATAFRRRAPQARD